MKRTLFGPVAALAALCSAQTAAAQAACVDPDDLTATITYALPIAFDAAMQSCDAQLSAGGFMKAEGSAFADRFREKQDEAWPAAFRLSKQILKTRAERKAGSASVMFKMFDQLPPDDARLFVDALAKDALSSEIKTDNCGDIERGMELLAPLPPENVSGLATFILQMAGVKNPPICKSQAS